MKITRRTVSITLALASFLSANVAYAETVIATCYSPDGIRFDFVDGERSEDEDGYSNSTPTFFFTSRDPEFLIESWQAALPFPELIDRERADEIAPPSATKSVVVHHSKTVLHAVSTQGRDAYTTTLYLDKGVAIFTRIRLELGDFSSEPMGAIFSAKCNFSVLP